MSITTSEDLNVTLEDGLWKDSFDKLLEDKPALLELNVLKKNVRASYNFDSSIENSRDAADFCKKPKRLKKATKTISTPVGKLLKQPFKCKISPIRVWTSKSLFKLNHAPQKRQQNATKSLQSTILHPPTVVVEYNSLKQTNSKEGDSLEILLTQPKKIGKLSRVHNCNVPGKNIESKKRRVGIKHTAKEINEYNKNTQTQQGACDKIAEKKISKPTVQSHQSRPKRLTQAQKGDNSLGHIELTTGNDYNSRLLAAANDKQVNLNTETNVNGEKTTKDKVHIIDRPPVIDLSGSLVQNSFPIIDGTKHISKELTTSQSATEDASTFTRSSLSKNLEAVIQPGNRRESKRGTDSMVTIRKSFKELPITMNENTDQSINMPRTLPKVPEAITLGIERRQNQRNLRRTKDAVNKNIENAALASQVVNNLNENCNSTKTLSEIDAINTSSENVSDRETLNAEKSCSSNCLSNVVTNVSNTENIQKSSLNGAKLTENATKNASLMTESVRSLNENMQTSEDILLESSLEKLPSEVACGGSLSRISDQMVTVRKSNNNSKYLSDCINKQSVQTDVGRRQKRSSRRTLRQSKSALTEMVTETVLPKTQNGECNNLQINVENSFEAALLVNGKNECFNRISDALVTVRKSNNCKNISSRLSNQSLQTDNNTVILIPNTEITEQALKTSGESSIERHQRSLVHDLDAAEQSIVEKTPSTAASSRNLNPMVTVRKNRTSTRNRTSKEPNINMQFLSNEIAKPIEKLPINSSLQRISSNGNCHKNSKTNSQLSNVETNTDAVSSTINLCEISHPSIDTTKNNFENVSPDHIDCSLNIIEHSTAADELDKRQVSNLTIQRRRNKTKASKSRSYGRTLSSVLEIVNETEHIEENTMQNGNIRSPTKNFVQKRLRVVKFNDVPFKLPCVPRPNSAESRKNDSDVVFIEANNQIEQASNLLVNVNRRISKPLENKLSLINSANHSKNINAVSAAENSRNQTVNLSLQAGKWRKSLSALRRSQMSQAQIRQSYYRTTCQLESILDDNEDESVEYIGNSTFVGKRKTILIKPEDVPSPQHSFVNIIDYKERVLEYCNQTAPLSFDALYAKESMQSCLKIGEGVYGEVFMKKFKNDFIVCKVIPIEGSVLVNGETQKTFEQILPEIVISKELCKLKDAKSNVNNTTPGFVDIKKVSCVEGKYPQHLIKCWETYDKEKTSENDHPKDFPMKQLYIVLELEFAGKDLESFVFNNAEQSYAALQQITLTLAVAEEALEFEHRDLHWGNVLIRPTDDKEIQCKLSGQTMTVPTKGIKATIIDYTLSRMKYDNHCFYNDLANDEELFTATGDYQFDIYRMMRDILGSNWERFEPKTNVFWLSYIISKIENGVKYRNPRSKTHALFLRKLGALKNQVLKFNSACSFAKYMLNYA